MSSLAFLILLSICWALVCFCAYMLGFERGRIRAYRRVQDQQRVMLDELAESIYGDEGVIDVRPVERKLPDARFFDHSSRQDIHH